MSSSAISLEEFNRRLTQALRYLNAMINVVTELSISFPAEFREKLRRDGIHLEGNIRRKIRSYVTATLGITTVGKDWYFYRINEPVQEYRWRLAGEEELIVNKCKRYLDVLTDIVDQCENKFLKLSA